MKKTEAKKMDSSYCPHVHARVHGAVRVNRQIYIVSYRIDNKTLDV